jgi:hypothetical protein
MRSFNAACENDAYFTSVEQQPMMVFTNSEAYVQCVP